VTLRTQTLGCKLMKVEAEGRESANKPVLFHLLPELIETLQIMMRL
jgi:hypothetical protein